MLVTGDSIGFASGSLRLAGKNESVDNVFDIGKINQIAAITDLGQALLACGGNESGQQRLIAGAENGFGTQNDGLQTVRPRGVDTILAQFLRERVDGGEAARVGNIFASIVLVASIEDDAGRCDVEQTAHSMCKATGQHRFRAANIDGVEIGAPAPRRGERTGMKDDLDTSAGCNNALSVSQVFGNGQRPLLKQGFDGREVAAHERDAVAPLHESGGKVSAQKAGAPGDKNLHTMLPFIHTTYNQKVRASAPRVRPAPVPMSRSLSPRRMRPA